MTSSREAELRIYLDACAELQKTDDTRQADDLRDEIEAIGCMTDWPLLRRMCQRTVGRPVPRTGTR